MTERVLIRGLTLTHPWTACILALEKDVENRSWRPQEKGGKIGMYLAIHGGVPPQMPAEGKAGSEKWQNFRSDLNALRPLIQSGSISKKQLEPFTKVSEDGRRLLDWERFIWPGIHGVARLDAVEWGYRSPWSAKGQYQWVLGDITRFATSIPARGGRLLWKLEDPTLYAIREAYRQTRGNEPPF